MPAPLPYAGLKLEKIEEGLEVILAEIERITKEKVEEAELKKAKEMTRGRLAIRAESTNFLAEYFGTEFVVERDIETFEHFLSEIDKVTVDEVREVARELFKKDNFNLQIIAPLKNPDKFLKILNS